MSGIGFRGRGLKGDTGATGSTGSTGATGSTGLSGVGAYEYSVDKVGTVHKVWRTIDGQTVYQSGLSDAELDIAIENCMGDTADAIVINLSGRCDGAGRTLTIDRGELTITSNLPHFVESTLIPPRFEKIELVSAGIGGGLKLIKLGGLCMNTLEFNATTYAIQMVKTIDLGIRPNSTGHGVRYIGDGFIDHITHDKMMIQDRHDQSVDAEGAIHFANSNDGTGQIDHNSLRYHAVDADNTVMINFEAGRVGPPLWFPDLTASIFVTGHKFIKCKANAWIGGISFTDAFFECHESLEMAELDVGADRFKVSYNHCDWSISDAKTVALCDNNNPNGNWSNNPLSGIFGHNNIIRYGAGASFLDAVDNRGNRFIVDFSYMGKLSAGILIPKLHKQVIAGGSNTALATNGTDEYLPIEGLLSANTTAMNRYMIKSYDVIYRHLKAYLGSAPGTGNSRTFTLYVNGAPTALTCTISNAETVGTDWTHEVAVAAGVPHCWVSDGGVSVPTASQVKISAEMLWAEREA